MPPPPGLQPAFVDGPAGAIFTLRFPAAGGSLGTAALLVPPFAEEMNRARRFLAATGRGLAAQGHTALLPDLHGTGDSAGAFAAATWEIWQAELDTLTERLAAETGHPVHLIAVRTGALLAAATARQHPGAVAGLTLVQPVTDGGRFLDQLLRVRIAAAMAQGQRESRADLRAAWQTGEAVEVGGYAIAPALAEGLSACRLGDLPPPAGLPIAWLDIRAPGSDAPTQSPALPAGWHSAADTRRSIAAPAVWQLAEPETADPLVAELCNTLSPQQVAA
ncbi:serine aminopeptidase domain-containing protein [Rhodovibrio salinarum]|uniref:Serine aminopeptidase S33 domain-containing protein n=1 Tax=Rhodovibrio salinarum TaxID=1087 RepID=A0A934QFP6_9PROT|nr:alpha/beta hydrolase [Rhodovibrio salinarum]MBK1696019.1 hypothetical protein [Rhodovibrio salinarum]